MTSPKISIVIPTYKRPSLLAEAIESVLNNGYDDFEIIVSDDDADSKIEKIVEAYQKKSIYEIRYYAHSPNTTVYENWSFGASKCRGKYTFKLDDDDLILPGFLKVTTEFLDKNKEVGIVFTAIQCSRDRKVYSTSIDNSFFKNKSVVNGEEYAFAILENNNVPRNHKSIGVFRSELVNKIDYFRIMRTDVMFTVGMASIGDVGYIPQVYFEYRFLEKDKVGMSYHDLRETLYSLDELFKLPWVMENTSWMKREVDAKKIFYYVVPIIYIKDQLVNKGFLPSLKFAKKVIVNYREVRKNLFFWISLVAIFLIPKKIYFFIMKNYNEYEWPSKLINFLSGKRKVK